MENKKVEINYDKIRQDLKDLIREKLKGHDLKVSKIHEEIDKVLHQIVGEEGLTSEEKEHDIKVKKGLDMKFAYSKEGERILKSKELPVGTVRTWTDGKKYQKQNDGSWKEVSHDKKEKVSDKKQDSSSKNKKVSFKNLDRFNSSFYKKYQFGKPYEAAQEVKEHIKSIIPEKNKAVEEAGPFVGPALNDAFKVCINRMHDERMRDITEKYVLEPLEDYHKRVGEDNQYRGGNAASKKLIHAVKKFFHDYNKSADKAGPFLKPGLKQMAALDIKNLY